MKKKNTLRVKLFRTQKRLNILAVVLVVLGMSCSSSKAQTYTDASIDYQNVIATQTSSGNPFTFEHIGTPFKGMPIDRLGLPKLLDTKDALGVINKVFEEEGIHLEKNYLYEKDDIRVVLDGFDTKLNIGYLWICPYSIKAKMNNAWRIKYYDQIVYKHFLMPKIDAIYTPDKVEKLERKLKKMNKDKKYIISFDERIRMAKTYYKGPLGNYKGLLWEMLIQKHQDGKNEPAITYFSEYFKDSKMSRETEKSINDGLISNCNYFDEKEVLTEILNDIVGLENEAEKRKQYNNFVEFILLNNYYKARKESEYNPIQKILTIKDKKLLAEAIQAFGFEHLDKKLNLHEARLLDHIHQTKNFIAPISIEDRRFQYSTVFNKEEEEAINKLGIDKKNLSEEEYNQAYSEIGRRASERMKNNALKYLETQVRQYIQWAKQQGEH